MKWFFFHLVLLFKKLTLTIVLLHLVRTPLWTLDSLPATQAIRFRLRFHSFCNLTLALNAMLNVRLIVIASKTTTAYAVIRLRRLGYKLDLRHAHSSILKRLEFIPMMTQQCIPCIRVEHFPSILPWRKEWVKYFARRSPLTSNSG